MPDHDLRDRIETMLTQAASFARAGEPTEARARVRQALELVGEQEDEGPGSRESVVGLRRQAERQLEQYEKLRAEWNAKVAARGAEWHAREIAILRAPVSKHG